MKYGKWENFLRLLKKRLIIPILRSEHPPAYKAWGVSIGLGWAMTPLVGIQMWLVWITWYIARKVFKFHFSLPLGLAYTWVTNVFTMVPAYYVFYLTGRLVIEEKGSPSGESVKEQIASVFVNGESFVQQWIDFFKILMLDWGMAMMLGCIPYVIIFMILGYYLTMKYELMRQRMREKKLKRGMYGTNK